jgi:5-methylthioadenosine/S-adenosylhomocysteine deaminase
MRLLFFFLSIALSAEKVETILTADWVVTMDGERRVVAKGAVAIQKNRIVGVGAASDILKDFQGKRFDLGNSILMPGLINTHTHAPMSLMRGIADDLTLQDWLTQHIFPTEAKAVSPEFVRWGTLLACAEMALSGTTLFTDMYYFEEVIAAATKTCGIRGVLGQTVIKFPVADARTPEAALQRAEVFIKQYKDDPLITPAVAPHAVYTNADETLRQSRALANKYGVPMLIHLSETKKENDDLAADRKKTPTQLLDELGAFTGRTIAAHGVWLTPEDISLLAKRGVGVAHCPSSNMKLASGVAPVLELLQQGVAVGLGPDGPAGSNNDFDLLEEANLAANLQKVTRRDPRALPAKTTVEMLTINGARVVGLDKEIGSLEVGKRADVIAISLQSARAIPMFDVYSHLVYALKGSDVTDVMVEGKWIVRNRKLLTIDLAEVARQVEIWRKRLTQN